MSLCITRRGILKYILPIMLWLHVGGFALSRRAMRRLGARRARYRPTHHHHQQKMYRRYQKNVASAVGEAINGKSDVAGEGGMSRRVSLICVCHVSQYGKSFQRLALRANGAVLSCCPIGL